MTRPSLVPLAATLLCSACSSLGSDLPDESPPLASMDEPPALFEEPDDEQLRSALPLGGYTGIHVTDGRASLGGFSAGSAPGGVLVQRVVENSPGDAARVTEDDLILFAQREGEAEVAIDWPSDWREFELTSRPGQTVYVTIDRAGVEGDAEIEVAPRVRTPRRDAAERYREEDRVGLVLRTATEVEARAAGLGPGGGAVVVGLALESPWRSAGVLYGDVIVEVGDVPVAHPQVLLDAIRDADEAASLALRLRRGAHWVTIEAPLSERDQETRSISIPLLYSYGSERGKTETSILLGLLKKTTTKAAWEWRILWFISFGGGDADRLEELR